jgi:SAM-dependent methyltransferase
MPGVSKSSIETNPKEKFSNRALHYAKYRPRYPDAVLDFMKQELGLSPASVIADIGSGTGILSEMFLRNGNLVFGVEPNTEMREAAEGSLVAYPNFRSINASAETTTLPAASVDFVTAAQSFHWFERVKARKEFKRILKPRGWVVLIWNTRKTSTPFLQAYEQLVRYYARRRRVRHENVNEQTLRNFLSEYKAIRFNNFQALDYQGLLGRLLSSSYSPLPGDPLHKPMLVELHGIFDSYQVDGTVLLEYDTEVYCGRLSKQNDMKLRPLRVRRLKLL